MYTRITGGRAALMAAALLLGTTALVYLPSTPGHTLGEARGGISCVERQGVGEVPQRVCGIGMFDIVTGQPGTNNVLVEFDCHVVAVGASVATSIAPVSVGGCTLRQGDAEDPAERPIIATAPGVGEPKAEAETVGTTDGFVPLADGEFAVCWDVGGLFVDGDFVNTGGCGFDLLEPGDLAEAVAG